MDTIKSELFDIQSIIERGFRYNIPRYQRLYVWEDEQVKTLFNDIFTASQSEKGLYYIGGIITVKYMKLDNCFDLVDGQQRFTTLWLLANELGSTIKKFTHTKEGLRLNFSIRQNVEAYFNELVGETDKTSNDYDDLIRIINARKTIQSLISENIKGSKEKEKFIDFLIHKVKMVITEVPLSTDLNKLFETLNNRGVQLAQHEIFKAQLLSKFSNKRKRYRYGVLWNACSDMNNYIERSLTYETGNARQIANSYYYNDNVGSEVHNWDLIKEILKDKDKQSENLSLQQIIKKRRIEDDNTVFNKDDFDFGEIHQKASDDELEPVRSILTFPQLLLHALRIFLYKKGDKDIQRINEKELLKTFSKHFFVTKYENEDTQRVEEEKESLMFMDLVCKVREVFDKYVIKWVEESENNETHLIKKIYKQNQKYRGQSYYLRRIKTQEFEGFALLQSILYHSQQNTTQYWLTPFLYRLIDSPNHNEAYIWLKKLDNILFSSRQEIRGLAERTWECMSTLPDIFPTESILSEELGTNFPHYWFYKMEFILWHERQKFNKQDEWKSYKMSARNSIEHISPQNPRDPKDKLCESQLHHFGNLVLVTRSINSEYSDLPYMVKKAKFENKKLKGSIDSLKSDIIYSNNIWSDQLAIEHQVQMIEIIKNYFEKISNE